MKTLDLADDAVDVMEKHLWHHTATTHCSCGWRSSGFGLDVREYLKHVVDALTAADVISGDRCAGDEKSVYGEVRCERARQDEKWGEQNHPDADPVLLERPGGVTAQRLAEHHEVPTGTRGRQLCETAASRGETSFMGILVEEVGEAMDEIAVGNEDALREELVQVAAVAVQWVEAIDRRRSGAGEST